MIKSVLRQQFLAQRKALDAATLDCKNQAITTLFLQSFDFTQITSLHIFLPILQHNEFNTYLIIEAIRQQYPHITLVTSKSDFTNGEMQHYVLNPSTQLKENQWHIPEPVDGIPFLETALDMVILPLLCFDQQGYRVGYGKGFYDRFIERCATHVMTVGLSFFPPVEHIEDIHLFDLKMDFCITEDKMWSF